MSTIQDTDLFLAQRGATLYHVTALDLQIAANAWTPGDIPQARLLGWLDGSDNLTITLNGSLVSEWRDKSAAGIAAGRYYSQSVADQQPVRNHTSSGWVGRSGNLSDFLAEDLASSTELFPHTCVSVLRGVAPVNSATPFSFLLVGGGDFRRALALEATVSGPNRWSTTISGVNIAANSAAQYTPAPDQNTLAAVTAGYAANAADWRLRVNGSLGTARGSSLIPAISKTSLCFTETAQHITLQGSYADNIDLIEKIEGWSAHKFGFAANLAAGHPYKDAPPTR